MGGAGPTGWGWHRPQRRSAGCGRSAVCSGGAVCSAAIFVVALLVRLVPLGLYVTPDEPIWVLRSVQFLDAVEAGDWAAIPQTGHPGMTTMVLGALGVWLTEQVSPAEAAVHRDWVGRIATLAPENGAAFPHLVAFLPAGRAMVAWVTALSLALVYLIGRRRIGDRAARLAALFLALDPFVAGHSGLLHTDALQATFVLLAVLFVLPRRDRLAGANCSRHEWLCIVAAAFFLALAGLTKMLGLLAAPGLALAALLWWRGSIWERVTRVSVLALLTTAFLVALYPPTWVDPRLALKSLVDAVTYHEGIGLRPVFFAGETSTDPGLWFYPVVLLFRLTPPVLIGLLGWAWPRRAAARALRSRDNAGRSRRVVWVLLPALSYLVGISVAGKKFDRYVLSVIPLLTLMAALTWLRRWRRWRLGVLTSLVLPWALVSVLPLQYADPLLGGPWVAQEVVPLGWGEASGLAARWINRQAQDATVMTGNVPGTAGLFVGETWSWAEEKLGCTGFVIGQEDSLPATYALLEDVWAAGREQVRVYGHTVAVPGTELLVAPGALPGIASDAVAPITDSDTLRTWLAQRAAVGDTFIWVHASQCYPLTEAQLRRVIDEAAAFGALACESGDPVLGFTTERCTVLSALPQGQATIARLGGGLDLVAAAWENPVQAPDPLTVHLRWQALAPSEELEVYLALRDVEGTGEAVWAEGGRRLLSDWGWATPDWPVGESIDAEAYVPLSLGLPPGMYSLVLRVSGPGGTMGLTTPDGAFGGTELILGDVRVTAASSAAGELDLSAQVAGTWPGLKVVGAELSTGSLQAGRRMSFSLGLERGAGTPPEALRWDLACDGVRYEGGTLSLSSRNLDEWPLGYRYVLRFAPRVDPGTPEGECAVSVWPAGERAFGYERALVTERIVVGNVTIVQRPRSYDAPEAPDVVSDVTAARLADLLGADISAPELGAGDTLAVTLYWRAQGDAARDYTVFVHAVGPDGQVWGQSDAMPAQGAAPTMTWAVGEIIADEHRLTLREGAPGGTYGLYVGLYDAGNGSRVTLFANGERVPDDRALVTTFEVGHQP